MIFRSARVPAAEFERVTGWRLESEGLCQGALCVRFRPSHPDVIELGAAARALGMPLVHDAEHGLFALGARTGGHALESAVAPDFELPDAHGESFRLSSLRGQSRPRPIEEATAAAHFALGQTLHARGERDAATRHFRSAHRLQPDNWTYRRDAWSLAGAERERTYGTGWVEEVRREGVENYYPALRLD